jgi:predicted transcriptional regulator
MINSVQLEHEIGYIYLMRKSPALTMMELGTACSAVIRKSCCSRGEAYHERPRGIRVLNFQIAYIVLK